MPHHKESSADQMISLVGPVQGLHLQILPAIFLVNSTVLLITLVKTEFREFYILYGLNLKPLLCPCMH